MGFTAEERQELAEGLDAAFGDEDNPMVWVIEEQYTLDNSPPWINKPGAEMTGGEVNG